MGRGRTGDVGGLGAPPRRWGMPGPPQYGGAAVTNIRNVSSPYWRGWLAREICGDSIFRHQMIRGDLRQVTLDKIRVMCTMPTKILVFALATRRCPFSYHISIPTCL
jgi:hypothetical protein